MGAQICSHSCPLLCGQKEDFIKDPTAGLPWWLNGKNPPANTGDAGEAGLVPGLRRSPGEGDLPPRPVFLPGKSHGQNSLVSYSPKDHKRLRHDLASKQQGSHCYLKALVSLLPLQSNSPYSSVLCTGREKSRSWGSRRNSGLISRAQSQHQSFARGRSPPRCTALISRYGK